MASFQERVFKIVKKIPRGNFLTYKKLAKLAGRPRAWRAVGNILNKNQNQEISCHRVIRSDGRIGGHKDGLQKKAYLLQKEGVVIKNGRVVL